MQMLYDSDSFVVVHLTLVRRVGLQVHDDE